VLAKKTSKNQITLPKRIAEQFPTAQYFEVTTERGRIVLRPVEIDPLAKVHAKLAELGISEADVPTALAWARRRRG
jgi:hypothetical protein